MSRKERIRVQMLDELREAGIITDTDRMVLMLGPYEWIEYMYLNRINERRRP